MASTNETERIIKLMLLIRESGPVSFSQIQDALAEEYGPEAGSVDSNRRRFERDKKTLQGYGVFLVVDQDQKYSLDHSRTVAAPIDLTGSQISLLRLLCSALLDDVDYPFKDELRMVLVKLSDELELPDMLPAGLSDSEKPKGRQGDARGLEKVKKAIAARKNLMFTYVDSKGEQSRRTVEPSGAFFFNHHGYIAAYDGSVSDTRLFRLDRMSDIRVNASNPKAPDFASRPFDVTDFFGLPFQFGDDDFVARVELRGRAASIAQQLTLGLGSLEWAEGSCIWTIRCKDARLLAQWCVENGPGLAILEPDSARSMYLDGLAAYLSSTAEGRG